MCPYLPDLFVCVSQIFAELNSCNWIKLPKTFSTKTRRTTWKEMIYILRTRKLERKKNNFETEDDEEDIGSAVHIFGWINFPSEWRTFDSFVNPRKCTTVRPILRFPDALMRPWHFEKENNSVFFVFIVFLSKYRLWLSKPNFALLEYSWIS